MAIEVISNFQGEHRFLSNFYPAVVSYEQANYPSVEHAYQAAKTTDLEARTIIKRAATPALAKQLGRQVTDIRVDWEKVKLDVMTTLVRRKFRSPKNLRLRKWLVETREATLIEGNHWGDIYWGVCNGVGENHLGKILMRVRSEVQF